MTYQAQADLQQDPEFQRRVYACLTEQAEYFKDAAGLDQKALAESVLRGEPGPQQTMLRLVASSPGLADKADNGDGTVDQAKVTDQDLLSTIQGSWPVVAGLYFDADGTPK